MKITIDEEEQVLTCQDESGPRRLPLYSDEAFEIIAQLYLTVGWNQKYTYTFSWLGRPIIQLPDDMFRIQEVIHRVKPDVIIETGVAHGGSLIYYAGLCEAMKKGRIIGIDIEIRSHNRTAIEAHPLFDRIELLEGSSTAPNILEEVRRRIQPGDVVFVSSTQITAIGMSATSWKPTRRSCPWSHTSWPRMASCGTLQMCRAELCAGRMTTPRWLRRILPEKIHAFQLNILTGNSMKVTCPRALLIGRLPILSGSDEEGAESCVELGVLEGASARP